MKIVSVGEVLWDILPSTEHLGGAPFNFAWHAHNLGHEVCLVSAVGNDDRGRRVLELMDQAGLSTSFVRRISDHPTGTVTVAMDSLGLPHYTIHRPAAMTSLLSAQLTLILCCARRLTGFTLALCSK